MKRFIQNIRKNIFLPVLIYHIKLSSAPSAGNGCLKKGPIGPLLPVLSTFSKILAGNIILNISPGIIQLHYALLILEVGNQTRMNSQLCIKSNLKQNHKYSTISELPPSWNSFLLKFINYNSVRFIRVDCPAT